VLKRRPFGPPLNFASMHLCRLTVLCMAFALFGSNFLLANDTSSEGQPVSLHGEIVFSGLDALPWDSSVRIYLEDMTAASNPQFDVVAQRTIVTHGEQIPIQFTLPLSGAVILEDHDYLLCADITIGMRRQFVCKEGVSFRGKRLPEYVKLVLQRVS